MERDYDPGYRGPYRRLVLSYPDESVYPADSFRVEWGPIFHRGRLDGSARVLVLGQDPAAHDAIAKDQQIEAIISLGQLADQAYQAWRRTPLGASSQAAYVTVRHPTYPES